MNIRAKMADSNNIGEIEMVKTLNVTDTVRNFQILENSLTDSISKLDNGHGIDMDEMVKLINNNAAHSVEELTQVSVNCRHQLEERLIKLEEKLNICVEKLEQTQKMCNSISDFKDEILQTMERLENHVEKLPVEQTQAMCNSISDFKDEILKTMERLENHMNAPQSYAEAAAQQQHKEQWQIVNIRRIGEGVPKASRKCFLLAYQTLKEFLKIKLPHLRR